MAPPTCSASDPPPPLRRSPRSSAATVPTERELVAPRSRVDPPVVPGPSRRSSRQAHGSAPPLPAPRVVDGSRRSKNASAPADASGSEPPRAQNGSAGRLDALKHQGFALVRFSRRWCARRFADSRPHSDPADHLLRPLPSHPPPPSDGAPHPHHRPNPTSPASSARSPSRRRLFAHSARARR